MSANNTIHEEWFPSSIPASGIAFVCAQIATIVVLRCVVGHLRNYQVPKLQKHVVRILVIVPFYAELSWLSLATPSFAPYYTSIRDMYASSSLTFFLSSSTHD